VSAKGRADAANIEICQICPNGEWRGLWQFGEYLSGKRRYCKPVGIVAVFLKAEDAANTLLEFVG